MVDQQLPTYGQRLFISQLKLRLFRRYVSRYLKKNFHGLRILKEGYSHELQKEGPLIIIGNHPSWWDPMLAIHLADYFAHDSKHYAPIEAEMLERYSIFKKLGFYGVEKDSLAGAKDFLKISQQALSSPDAVIWMTPQGRFSDVRERPVEFKKGLAYLVKSVANVRILPMALEYPFWDEKTPEVLVHFGEVFEVDRSSSTSEIHQKLELALADTQDTLAESAVLRDSSCFTDILAGNSGVGGVYGWWQKLRGYKTEHGGEDV